MQRYRPWHRSGYKARMSYQSTSHYNTPIYLVSSDGVLILRASSFFSSTRIFFLLFYAHLQHDQDFPSDTRPRDDLAPRLAPGHVLAAHPLELHLTINKLPMAAPVMASSETFTPVTWSSELYIHIIAGSNTSRWTHGELLHQQEATFTGGDRHI